MKKLLFSVLVLLSSAVLAEETVGEKVGKTAREVQDGVSKGVENFGKAIKETSKDVAKEAKKAAKEVAKGAEEFAKDVKQGYENAGNSSD